MNKQTTPENIQNSGSTNSCKPAGYVAVIFVTVCMLVVLMPVVTQADDENCFMCHSLAGLGVFEEGEDGNAVKRIFYVNEELYKASYHGRVLCTGCHEGVKEIPHTDVKKVDCASDCHMKDPSTNSVFTHKLMVDDLAVSVHGKEGAEKSEDLPSCKDCHNNKTYQMTVENQLQSMNFLKVCTQCHESEEWAERFYEHTFYRASTRRSSKEIVALCSRCHANKTMMDKHDLDVVVGFKDTFHGKAIIYGDEDVANCLNCHAPYELDYSPHRIGSREKADSAVHADNKLATCRQSGCHAKAKDEFAARGNVHPSSYTSITRVTLKGKDGTTDFGDIAFRQWVVHLIGLVYKVLIAVVVGAFVLHRLLDIYATRRERKRARKV